MQRLFNDEDEEYYFRFLREVKFGFVYFYTDYRKIIYLTLLMIVETLLGFYYLQMFYF